MMRECQQLLSQKMWIEFSVLSIYNLIIATDNHGSHPRQTLHTTPIERKSSTQLCTKRRWLNDVFPTAHHKKVPTFCVSMFKNSISWATCCCEFVCIRNKQSYQRNCLYYWKKKPAVGSLTHFRSLARHASCRAEKKRKVHQQKQKEKNNAL